MVSRRIRGIGVGCVLAVGAAFNTACSLSTQIPVVADERIEKLVQHEAQTILSVADPRGEVFRYRFALSAFPRPDLLGLSLGQGRIYISYKLAQLALTKSYYRWLLRQTLAHEIAHELAGHADRSGPLANSSSAESGVTAGDLGLDRRVQFQNYSVEKELQADLYGMAYWARLGWNCAIWIDILREFQRQDYAGDSFHPTDRRLEQASASCAASRKARTVDPAETVQH